MPIMARDRLKIGLPAIAGSGLAAGFALWSADRDALAKLAWSMGVIPVLAGLIAEIIGSLARREVGLDIVAALSMSAALIFGEALAAAVVALMYAGGMVLESFAQGRARREMSDLLSRVARTATLQRDGGLLTVPLDDIVPGNLLMIRRGEVAPVDGTLGSDQAVLDQSALTGESLPVRLTRGATVLSGATNAGDAFDLCATHRAADSTYAGIVRLVRAAQASRAPMTRMADRFSLVFLVVTVVLASAAWWLTGDPIRAVAVLVVATPCPLILAVPVALVAGLSRAARFGVLIKGARALEAMARVKTLIVDKTGTLTDGRPGLVSVHAADGFDKERVLCLAAALDQLSQHPVAQAVVAAARTKGAVLPVPTNVVETPGAGVTGLVDGHAVVVGGTDFVAARTGVAAWDMARPEPGAVVVAVAVDGQAAGWLVMADALRPGIATLLSALHRHGIGRIVLATGDHRSVAMAVAKGLALDGRPCRSDTGPKGATDPVRARKRTGDDGGRRRERCARAGRGGCGRRNGRARGRSQRRGRRCCPAGGSSGPPSARPSGGARGKAHRPAKCRGWDRAVGDRNVGGGLRVPGPGTGRGAARGHRCRRHSERLARLEAWHE